MPNKEEINNVKSIMEKSKKFAKTPEDKKKLDEIIKGFSDVSDRYLNEAEGE